MRLEEWIRRFNEEESLPNGLRLPETTTAQLVKVIGIRYQAAHMFEPLMRHLLKVVEKDADCRPLMAAIQKNLQEERGEGKTDYGPAHVLGRRSFLQAIGIDYLKWKAPLGNDLYNLKGLSRPVQGLIGLYRTMIDAGPLVGGAAMLYWEGRIARLDYPLLLERVDACFGFAEVVGDLPRSTPLAEIPPRWHLQSHAEHDAYHEQELIEAILGSVRGPYGKKEVKIALLEARSSWEWMWGGLAREVFF